MGDFGTFVHVLNQIKHLKEKSASRNIRELLCLFTFYRFITAFFFSLLVCLEDSFFFFFPFGERRCIFAFPLVLLFFFFYSPDVWRVRGIAGRMSMRQSFSTTAGIMG